MSQFVHIHRHGQFLSQRFVALKSNTKQKSEILTRIDTSGRPSPIHPACLPPESPPQPSAATIIFSCHHQQQSRERRWLDDVPSERALRGRWLVTKWKGLNLLVCLFGLQRHRRWAGSSSEYGHCLSAPCGHPVICARASIMSVTLTKFVSLDVGLNSYSWLAASYGRYVVRLTGKQFIFSVLFYICILYLFYFENV